MHESNFFMCAEHSKWFVSNSAASNLRILFRTSSLFTRMGTYIDQGKVEFQHEDTSDFHLKALIMSQIACFNAEILHGMNE